MEAQYNQYSEKQQCAEYIHEPQPQAQNAKISHSKPEIRMVPKIQICKVMEMIRLHTHQVTPPH